VVVSDCDGHLQCPRNDKERSCDTVFKVIDMLEILRKQFNENMPNELKISYLREFLQVLILKIMYDRRYFKNLTFTGGTALRLLFELQRFSEDLDFSLTEKKGYNFNDFVSDIELQLKKHNLNVETRKQDKRTVQNVMIKFKDVLFELHLSNFKSQNLSVRIEIDGNPPQGWNSQVSLISKTYVFTVTHFDLPSLYATKLHACFFRKYTKGRDIYDFLWYLGKNMQPNYELLNNAIFQTEKKNLKVNANNFKEFLLEEVRKIDFEKAKKDVERFLIEKRDLRLFDRKLIQEIIESKY